MRIHHVIASVLPHYGGPSYSVPALCRALAAAGHEVALHVHEPVGAADLKGVRVYAYDHLPLLPRLGLSRQIPWGLRRAAREADIMHVHGQWMLCNIWPAWAVAGTRCQLVTSPRGMLEPWALQQSPRLKRVMWALCQ